MVRAWLAIEEKSVVVAGSGPLLLAVAAYLKRQAAKIPVVAEQASLTRLTRFGFGLWNEGGKLGQAIKLKLSMRFVPLRAGWWPLNAEGDRKLESVTLTNGRQTRRIRCDHFACALGLVPDL